VMLNTAYEPQDRPAAPDKARRDCHDDTCIYFGCPDVDGTYEQLRTMGLELEKPKIAYYGMKQLYLKDPDGFGLCFQWKA